MRSAPRACVVELVGLACEAGDGSLTLRVTAGRGGCLTQRITLRVGEPVATPRFDITYVAFTAKSHHPGGGCSMKNKSKICGKNLRRTLCCID